MKLWCLGIVMLLSSLVCAQTTPNPAYSQSAPTSTTAVGKALQDAIAERAAAIQKGDTQALAKTMSDDYMLVDRDGTVKTKAERLAQPAPTPTGTAGTTTMANLPTDEKVRMFGPNNAVHTFQTTGADAKRVRVTVVWAKQGGAWKVVSAQLTEVSGK